MRTPARERALGGRRSHRLGSPGVPASRPVPVCSPSVRARPEARGGAVAEPVGDPGLGEPVRPLDETARSTNCSWPTTVAPSSTGATGMRSAPLDDLGGGVLRRPRAHVAETRPCAGAEVALASSSSASSSAWSISTRKSSNCWRAMVQKPDEPVGGGLDGGSSMVGVGTGAAGAREGEEERREGVHGHRRHGLEHRHVDVLAGPVEQATRQSRDRAHGGVGAATTADPPARGDRRTVRRAGSRRAAPSLEGELVGGAVPPRPGEVVPKGVTVTTTSDGCAAAMRRRRAEGGLVGHQHVGGADERHVHAGSSPRRPRPAWAR